eukprot:scaffold4070_cov104-Cylindrotheca_fusiformis.AAC.1
MPKRVKGEVEGPASTDEIPSTSQLTIEPTDEEEVVREIDVFLSPELAEQIHLIQFPLQSRALSSPESAR